MFDVGQNLDYNFDLRPPKQLRIVFFFRYKTGFKFTLVLAYDIDLLRNIKMKQNFILSISL